MGDHKPRSDQEILDAVRRSPEKERRFRLRQLRGTRTYIVTRRGSRRRAPVPQNNYTVTTFAQVSQHQEMMQVERFPKA